MTGKGPIIISRSSVTGRGARIPGVFPSSRFGEQVVSTGIPSLDLYIGGGLPLGTVCLLSKSDHIKYPSYVLLMTYINFSEFSEDTYPSRYADLVLKCFLAEGATYSHHLYIASDKVSPAVFAAELPGLKRNPANATDDTVPTGKAEDTSGGLKIAWRYGSAHSSGTGITKGQKEAKFEFKKKTSAAELGSTNLHFSNAFEADVLDPVTSEDLLREVAEAASPFEVYDFEETTSAAVGIQRKPANNLIRIGISHCEQQVLSPKFMMALRAIVRHTNSCAVLTISEYNVHGEALIMQCERYADYVIRLEVILNEKRKAELGDVDGICDVVKMSSVNTLKPNELPRDLGFSFRNKRLTFQVILSWTVCWVTGVN